EKSISDFRLDGVWSQILLLRERANAEVAKELARRESIQLNLESATKHFSKQELNAAMDRINDLLKLEPTLQQALQLKTKIQDAVQQKAKAQQLYEEHLGKAKTALDKMQWEEAIENCKNALIQIPQDTAAQKVLSDAQNKLATEQKVKTRM